MEQIKPDSENTKILHQGLHSYIFRERRKIPWKGDSNINHLCVHVMIAFIVFKLSLQWPTSCWVTQVDPTLEEWISQYWYLFWSNEYSLKVVFKKSNVVLHSVILFLSIEYRITSNIRVQEDVLGIFYKIFKCVAVKQQTGT